MRENWQADKLSYRLGPEPGLRVGPLQQLPHLWTIGACEGDELNDPNQQYLYDTGHRQNIQEEPQRMSVISGVVKPRVSSQTRWPQWLMATNPWKKRWMNWRVNCVPYRPHYRDSSISLFALLFCLSCLVFDFSFKFCFTWEGVARVEGGCEGMRRWVGMKWMMWNSQKINKSRKNFKKRKKSNFQYLFCYFNTFPFSFF